MHSELYLLMPRGGLFRQRRPNFVLTRRTLHPLGAFCTPLRPIQEICERRVGTIAFAAQNAPDACEFTPAGRRAHASIGAMARQ